MGKQHLTEYMISISMYDWIGALVTIAIIVAIGVLWYFTCGRYGRYDLKTICLFKNDY